MAEKSMFWNQPTNYTAQEFAKFFAPFLTDGVYVSGGAMGLGVSMSGMTATVAAGKALMRGYYYENDGAPALTFTLSAAPTVSGIDRIDRIVLRLDTVAESIVAVLKKGTESSAPQPPTLTSSGTVLEMPLAQIRVKANTSTGTVTDERVPVSGLIEIPFAEMILEFNQFLSNREGLSNAQLLDMEGEFNAWFNTIQSRIDEITELSLQSDIDTNSAKITALESDKMENNRIKLSTSDADLSQMSDGDIWIKYE